MEGIRLGTAGWAAWVEHEPALAWKAPIYTVRTSTLPRMMTATHGAHVILRRSNDCAGERPRGGGGGTETSRLTADMEQFRRATRTRAKETFLFVIDPQTLAHLHAYTHEHRKCVCCLCL